MIFPILSTKLHIPPPPRNLVPRDHLTARLDAGAQNRLILLSAPAGFGKTSLLAEWVDRRREAYQVCWLQLDEGDNELIRFLSYLIAALQTQQPDIGEASLSSLQAMPPAPMQAALGSLINELDSLANNILFILDDYHLIDTPAIHAALDFLIEYLPGHICLIIATRTDPPLPLHRWRARRQMTEIRVEDLRFSAEETREFLASIGAEQISAGDVEALDTRIEGWIAGLQMAALSMQGKQNVHEFIESFSGSNRYILDYLSEEIFNRQPPHLQHFLLRTSILERLCAPLCQAVLPNETASPDQQGNLQSAQTILEYLEHTNLFLLPMDEERRWYRYHNLFAGLLRQRLRRTWPDEIPDLLRRASAWCAAQGLIDEAFKYALSAKDVHSAADLVESQALEQLKRGDLASLLSRLHQLPQEIVFERPWLSAYFAWALLLTGQLESVERYLAVSEEKISSVEDSDDLLGHVSAIRAYSASQQGDVERAYALAHRALDLLPEENLTVRCVVSFVLGGINLLRKDHTAALESMHEAGRIGELAGNIHLAVSALSTEGNLLRIHARTAEAEQAYSRALLLGTGRTGRPLPITAGVHASLAELYLDRNDLNKAQLFAETALELAKQWGNVDSLAGSYLVLARVAYTQGNSVEVKKALAEARRLAATQHLMPGFTEQVAVYENLFLSGNAAQPEQRSLIEPLSEREVEVLHLIAQGRSNPEIAEELIIALGTVKAHTSTIYRKLDVRSRTEAVLRAQELGIL
jgi:LuxR family transcriptional regulator, maltose regulon positive regulatory protein